MRDRLLFGNLRRGVGDRLHHRVPDAGIIQGVAGAFDKSNLGFALRKADIQSAAIGI
jgi:hypothetical protein